MADRERRKTAVVVASGDDKTDQLKLRDTMKDLLVQVLAHRPLDPVSFIATILENRATSGGLLNDAYVLLSETHHSQPVFFTNVKLAYDLLTQHKVKKGMYGLNGGIYMELLNKLCRDVPQPVSSNLFKKIECYDFEVLPFDVFRSSVFTCCVLQDYTRLCSTLYDLLDPSSTESADSSICGVVLSQLSIAVSKSSGKPLARLESGVQLGPEGLAAAIEQAKKYEPTKHGGTMKRDDFILRASDSFIRKVHHLS